MKRLILLAALLWAGAACAQAYPSKPIKFVVPFPPGGNLDFLARAIQPRFCEFLGVRFMQGTLRVGARTVATGDGVWKILN